MENGGLGLDPPQDGDECGAAGMGFGPPTRKCVALFLHSMSAVKAQKLKLPLYFSLFFFLLYICMHCHGRRGDGQKGVGGDWMMLPSGKVSIMLI